MFLTLPDVSHAYRATGTPTGYVLDAEGNVTWSAP